MKTVQLSLCLAAAVVAVSCGGSSSSNTNSSNNNSANASQDTTMPSNSAISSPPQSSPQPSAEVLTASAPTLKSSVVMSNLRSPWDFAFAADGSVLFTEKCHGLSLRTPSGQVQALVGNTADFALRADDWFCQGQSGVHGVALDPLFEQGQRFVYVFAASNKSTNPRSSRIVRFKVSAQGWTLSERTDIVTDIAFKEAAYQGGPGAHSGGRIRFGPDGHLWVTTGDNHSGSLPQDPQKLGGKVLRVDRNGNAAPGNNAPAGFDARIYTYGHRNPQGIAFRPGLDQVFTSEHGPNHSDEVTKLAAGGNAGWDPQNRPALTACVEGYCGYAGDPQSMPMTDKSRFPNAMSPVWANSDRSQGMGPATFLNHSAWGMWNGALAVGMMGAQRLDFLILDNDGKLQRQLTVTGPATRLRSLVQSADGPLWALSDDGQLLKFQLN